jgi:threonine/homoserine/homoserine lactone efflux protein
LKEVSQLADGDNNSLIKAVGGILFIGFGFYTFKKKVKETKLDLLETKGLYSRDYWMLFIKGLILNLANPLVVFYWFSVMTAGRPETSDEYAGWYMIVYLSVILITFFSIDVLKIIGAKKLRPFITAGVLRSLNHITGSVLMAFGIFLIVHSLVIWLRHS